MCLRQSSPPVRQCCQTIRVSPLLSDSSILLGQFPTPMFSCTKTWVLILLVGITFNVRQGIVSCYVWQTSCGVWQTFFSIWRTFYASIKTLVCPSLTGEEIFPSQCVTCLYHSVLRLLVIPLQYIGPVEIYVIHVGVCHTDVRLVRHSLSPGSTESDSMLSCGLQPHPATDCKCNLIAKVQSTCM